MIEECKLKVVYASPNSTQYNVDENTSKELGRGLNVSSYIFYLSW